MARIDIATAGGKNVVAFLDMIALSELGEPTIANSDDGYNVIVGGTPLRPTLFTSYQDHPRVVVTLRDARGNALVDRNTGKPLQSTAAGRYQELEKNFDAYRHLLGLRDFSPRSQDLIALRQIRECGALSDISAGRVTAAIGKCAHIWASLPGAGYGQHENSTKVLLDAYQRSGGTVCA